MVWLSFAVGDTRIRCLFSGHGHDVAGVDVQILFGVLRRMRLGEWNGMLGYRQVSE